MRYVGLDRDGWPNVRDEDGQLYAVITKESFARRMHSTPYNEPTEDGYVVKKCRNEKDWTWDTLHDLGLRKKVVLCAWPMVCEVR